MKILHINGNYLCTRLFSCLVEESDKLCKNTVYVPRRKKQLKVFDGGENVISSLCYSDVDRFFFFRKSKKIFADLEKKVNIQEFDASYAPALFSDGDLSYRLYLKYKIPYIVAISNTDVNLFFKYRKNLHKRGLEILKNASAVIFISDGYKNKVINRYVPKKLKDVISEKSFIIPFGIDDFWYNNKSNRLKSTDKGINVVCVGSIDKNKNILTLIKALEILIQRGYDVKLDVAGRPTDENVLSKIKEYPFAKYYGCLDKEELINLYRNADVFALPSFHETFGLVYAEAMSQGLPIVYTKGEGFDGQFAEGEVGYSVNPTDPMDIAEKILVAYKNRDVLAENAISAVEKFKWQVIARQYMDLYEKIT